ncbi:type II secretion system secretin GspD [Maricaulis sp.]|uniref:type II secretion system secretin GspD n=1 Tax=Maricaulis sp. TaxID=1486257 RepID=UPI001B2E3F66|nr:type II secretion system secretin GspD [Maricaulis sp.]MBO6797768.1 type II secretion system secretin GspD [Maricaulis sp.]
MFKGLVVSFAAIVTLSACASLMPDARTVHESRYAGAPVSQPGYTPSSTVEAEAASEDTETVPGEISPTDRLVYFDSTSASRLGGRGSADELDGRTLRLNFIDAPVADVVRAIISEALGQTVMVADGVDGRVSLSSRDPSPARAALRALETVLAESNLVLVERNEGFLLTRLDSARPSLGGSASRLGYGGQVVPIEHTDPSAVLSLLDPFLSDNVQVVPHDDLGVLVIAGTGPDVEAARDAAMTFDRPFLTGRVIGMLELNFVSAETVTSELNLVLQGLGLSTEAVRVVALPRLNMLLVTARTQDQFDRVTAWIDQFDRPSGGSERRLRYYVVRNAPATVLATQITAAFAGGQSGDGQSLGPRFQGEDAAEGDDSNEEEGRLAIIPDELNNALIIRATDQEYREILELVQMMDVMPPQVLIEATIAEVRLRDGLDFGVRWFFENGDPGEVTTVRFSDSETGSTAPIFPGFSYAFSGTDVSATLNTLRSMTDVTVLSAPSIMVQNNQRAHLQVGDEVPIVTQTATSVTESNAPIVSAVELRETGIILQVTPRINASGMVVLEVTQEVSSVRPTTTSGIDSPTIQILEFTSTVSVRTENTIALGGLIREQTSDNESRIPGLGDIPGVGNLFRNRGLSSERNELIIFLTPRIIRTDADTADALSHVRRQLEALELRQPRLFEQ